MSSDKKAAVDARKVEEASLNAWPGLQQMFYDGWVLRFARGYTKRANSVNAVHPGRLDPGAKIERCIELYAARHLPPIFRLTPYSQLSNLDALLETRGFRVLDVTSVQTLCLDTLPRQPAPQPRIWRDDLGGWVERFRHLSGCAADIAGVHSKLLLATAATAVPMTLESGGQTLCCGLAVMEEPYVGIFDMITAPRWRRRGYARRMLAGTLAWAVGQGARAAYLQVVRSNTAAMGLYAGFGFAEIYRYWYRILGEVRGAYAAGLAAS